MSGAGPVTFPGFDVISELGRGAETVVYRVRRHGRDYALKLLAAADGDSGQLLTALRREAALLGCVGHPLLPRIIDVGQVEAGPYLVLEHVDGRTLSETLRSGRLDEARALRLASDVAGPLAAAHRAGLVHRDVKPDNIIVERDGTGRLIDFGLAARGGRQHDRVAGTLLYSAPEQTGMLKRPVDGRSDLYALGVVLFEAVTGQTPFHSSDAGELIRQHATAPVPDPRSIRSDVSATFAAIIVKLMAKDPDDRYQSGESLLADVHRLSARPGALFEVGSRVFGVQHVGPDALVGRAEEVVSLASRWLRAREGAGGCALVQGPAGVGKSRLVREVTTAVATDGDLLLYGKCVPDDPVPLAPLRTAVERGLRAVDRLPPAERDVVVDRLRRAAGRGGPLLRALSPMLAALVQAPELGESNRHEQFTNAVAAFLLDLAEEFGGAVLQLDDVQWLDGATRRVLQQMATSLPDARMLVIATGRDDDDNLPALELFAADMGPALDTRLPLAPLAEDAVVELVRLHLGGMQVAEAATDELVARVGGNPFTVVEYVRAVIDAGLLTPSWGGWRLDVAGLDRLELSGDALHLVLQRIAQLEPESRRLLAAGAATGRRFPSDLVAAVCNVDAQQGRDALREAESRRLVTGSGGAYRFLHDRIREALLAQLDRSALHRLHQRIAEVIESAGATDPGYVYATAHHYALGEAERTPEKVYASGFAAGRLALADQAPAEAVAFLEVAAAAARSAGLTPDAGFHLALGVSCSRAGRFADALGHLDRALQAEPDRLRRAGVLAEIAWLHLSAWDPGRALDAASRGLAELGRPLPRNRFVLTVTTLASFVVGLVIGRTKAGFGTADGPQREWYRLQAVFYDVAAYASTIRMDPHMRATMSFRSLYVINRLGPSTEYARHMAAFGVIANIVHLHRVARRNFERAARVAADLGDPSVVGHVEWRRGVGASMGGVDDGQIWMRAIVEHERWLDLGDFLTGVSSACVRLLQRGCTREAQRWYLRGRARLGAGAEAEGAGFGAAAACIPAQFGRPAEAATRLDALRRYLSLNPDNRTQVANLVTARLVALVEQGELGAPFDEVTAEFELLGIRPAAMLPEQRIYHVYEAYGRLERCHRALREDRTALIQAAARAVKQLGQGASSRILLAHHRVATADLAVLSGRPDEALGDLVGAELEILRLDSPMIAYEAARVRARAWRSLGEPAHVEQQARLAFTVAVEEQWTARAGWVRHEFGVADNPAAQSTIDAPAPARASADVTTSRDALSRRRLAALQQVSLAAATVLDPRELARVALEETVRILGAERAYLFLVDPDLDQLVPTLGRDGNGNDIDELTGYSTTLVERVHRTGQPVVITGSEEGVALGARSVQTHGLRSIMIAPLLFDTRLLGVVYLDSRVATGMFNTDDVDTLMAITNHIAVSLETARAAQLAVVVQVARRQRDVAEMLRAAMADQSATLDPDEVMRRLLRALTQTLSGEAAALLSWDGDELVVTASYGPAAAVGTRLDPTPAEQLDLAGLRAGSAGEGQQLATLLGSPPSWLAIPVAARGNSPGILLVGSTHHEAPQEELTHVAAALAGQGMTAYQNARLFSEVQRLATIDGLTGLYTRNHFFAEASRQSRIMQRYQRPLAAIMMDIDHFKAINDTHGHPVGDEVISAVAGRVRAAARDSDLLGRYGGEEFALVTPETGDSAAMLAERLRKTVCAEPVPTAAGPLEVTISVGVAYMDGGKEDLAELLAKADSALYAAKRGGRNRVVTATAAG